MVAAWLAIVGVERLRLDMHVAVTCELDARRRVPLLRLMEYVRMYVGLPQVALAIASNLEVVGVATGADVVDDDLRRVQAYQPLRGRTDKNCSKSNSGSWPPMNK